MSTIVFFRGFNTYETEDLRFGPLNFGLAHRLLEKEFKARGFNFFAAPKMGQGDISTQVDFAEKYVNNLISTQSLPGPLHLLGHSAGGVVARMFAHRINQNFLLKLKSVTTIASPNLGSRLAKKIIDLQAERPFWQKWIGFSGYDLEKRGKNFLTWTPEQIKLRNEEHQNLTGVSYASVISGTELRRLPIALQIINRQIQESGLLTDGVVELESQPWGHGLAKYSMDHGATLGLRTVFLPLKYRSNQKNFIDMVDKITTHLKSLE